jgi:hypothetical protein
MVKQNKKLATLELFQREKDSDVRIEMVEQNPEDLAILELFKREKGLDHLHKSFKLYSLIDSIMLHQIRTQEDESTLEFLGIGHGIYSNAIGKKRPKTFAAHVLATGIISHVRNVRREMGVAFAKARHFRLRASINLKVTI